MAAIDLSKVPEQVRLDFCAFAILRCAEAMKTPEGRAAIEKGKQAYLRSKAEQKPVAPKENRASGCIVIYRSAANENAARQAAERKEDT